VCVCVCVCLCVCVRAWVFVRMFVWLAGPLGRVFHVHLQDI